MATRRRAWAGVALWAWIGLAGCNAPATRDATQAPGAGSVVPTSASASGVGACTGGAAAQTLSGTVTAGALSGLPPVAQTRLFPLGLPCRQAAVQSDGTFTLALDSNETAFVLGQTGQTRVTLIAMLIGTQFSNVVAARTDVTVSSVGTAVPGIALTLGWANAAHVQVAFSSGASLSNAYIVAITDDVSLGPTIKIPGLFGANGFDTGYLPAGTYTLRIDASDGKIYLRPLGFPAGTGSGVWFFPAQFSF